jgi:phage-related protein
MKIGAAQASAALTTTGVDVNAFAKAMQAAGDIRFGPINELQRLGQPMENLRKRLAALADGVNLEPLLRGFEELSKLFDASTVSGRTLKTIVEVIGNALGAAFKNAVPAVKEVFERIELAAVKIFVAFYRVKNAISDAFKDRDPIITSAQALDAVKAVVEGLGNAATYSLRVLGGGIIAAGKGFYFLSDVAEKVKATLGVGWKEIGVSIVDGLTGGLFSKLSGLQNAGDALAQTLKKAFAGPSGIDAHSPSKWFEKKADDSVEGYKRGLDKGGPGVQSAAENLAPTPPGPGGGGGGGGGGSGRGMSLTVNIDARGASEEAAKKLAAPAFLADLTKAIQEALVGAGLPVQAGPPT